MGASPRPEKANLSRRVCLRGRRHKDPYSICRQRAPLSCSRTVFSEHPLRRSGKLGCKHSVPPKSLRIVIVNVQSPGGTKPPLAEAHTPTQTHQHMLPTPDPCDSSPALEMTAPEVGGQTSASTPCLMRLGRSAPSVAREGESPAGPQCRFDLDVDDSLCLSPIISEDSGCAADIIDLCCSPSAPETAVPPPTPSVGARGEGDTLRDEGYTSHQEALSLGAIGIGCIIQKSASPTPEGREATWHGGESHSPARPQVRRTSDPGRSQQSPSGSPHRPVVFRDEDWQKGKLQYVDAIFSHSSPAVAGGAVEELYNLISTVGQQGAVLSDTSWQHPADLTRRNYGKGQNMPRISLDQWYQLNSQGQRRFASVPLQFQRSPVL